MAALGMNSVQVNALFDEIDDQAPRITLLRSFQEQYRMASATLKQSQKNARLAESSSDALQIETQIDQLRAQLNSLTISIESQQDLIRYAILPSSFDATEIELVCEPEGMAAFLPVEYRFIELTDEDIAELLPAVMTEQQAVADGELLDTDTQLILSRYRNLPAVQDARSNLLYNLDAVKGAFYD